MNKKTISVVAAVIRDGERVFATQRGYGEFKDAGNSPAEKSSRAKQRKRLWCGKFGKSWIPRFLWEN